MKSIICSKYMIFPVNMLAVKKKLVFKRGDETVYQLDIKLDNENPDFYAYIDVSRFMGQTLEISVTPEMELKFREADEMDITGLYQEPERPRVHFTTRNGWNNDPNGLIYIDGVYHMFYQYNPAEPSWANMHWGHAESRDLIHWEEKDIVLFPDERGAMFSGSAILDKDNLLGKNADQEAALLFYTTTEPFCQHLSYSTDNFCTIHHWGEKPVVPHIKGSNRDPKVVFCQELGCYIMALYLDEDMYCLLKSEDFVNWSEFQRIQLQGDNECPDIFPICDTDGNRKWVFMGAHDKYLVGDFVDGKFKAQQPALPLHYGSSGYAGQTFSNLPDDRVVRVVWDRWGLPGFRFKGQMGIPMEMSLEKFENIYYLQANPVAELEKIYKTATEYKNVTLGPKAAFCKNLDTEAQLLRLRGSQQESGEMTVTAFGRSIRFNFNQNELAFGNCTAPISLTRNGLDVTVLFDRCSIELFADGGKIYASCINEDTFSDLNLPSLRICAEEEIKLSCVEIHSLKSIWEKQ